MDVQPEEQQESHLPSVWHLTREHLTLAGGTMLAATGVDLLAHLGTTGLVVGGILAFAAARHGQGLYRQVQGLLSPASAPPHAHPGKRSKRSVLDRALGRFPDMLEEAESEAGPLLLEDEHPAFAEPIVSGMPGEQRRGHATSRMLVDLAPAVRLDVDDLAGKAILIGGKRGIAPVILTQRLAQVNKKIMAQSEVLFLMRQTMDNDLARCMEYVQRSTASEEQIARLLPGQGIYIGVDGTQVLTQFSPRRSSGTRSHTPRAATALRYAHMPLRPIVATPAEVPSQQPASPPQQPAYAHQQQQSGAQARRLPEMGRRSSNTPKQSPTRHVSAALSPDLQQVYDAYEPGLSLRDIAKKINAGGGQISQTTVGKLVQRLKDKGLIDVRGNKV